MQYISFMRFINKYKGYHKLSLIFEKFPLRVARFKSTKWKRVQRLLSFKTKLKNRKRRIKNRNRLFFNNFFTKVSSRGWYRVDKYYENGRRIQNAISNSFDGALSTRFFKKALSSSYKSRIDQVYVNTLLKPEFRLDTFLWKLSFFRSRFQASQAISERRIRVNRKYVKGNYYLRKGDIITFDLFCSKNIAVKKVRRDSLFSKRFLTFVEVDYYLNCVIVLKDINELGIEDFFIIVKEYHSLKKLKDYI